MLLLTSVSFGQEQKVKNTLSITIGASSLSRQDLIFSPLIHTDMTVLNVGMAYIRQANLFQKISLRYGNFNPSVSDPYDFTIHGETHTAHAHSFNFIDVDYLIGKNVKESGNSTFTAGGLFVMDVQALDYVYGRTSSFGYYSTLGLGVFGRYQHNIGKKGQFTANVQLPLVMWLARSPYLVNDDQFIENTTSHSQFKTLMSFIEDGQLVTWNRLQTFDFEAGYNYNLNEKWSLGVAYMLEFIHSSQPRNLVSNRQSINLNANFNF
ncbi:hypothetical protein A9996_11560 [Gelidibacter algens]|nr:hypothetical protein A9996_11560 [Gelidibacter algens]